MVFLEFAQLLIALVLFAFFITQVVIPIWTNTIFFPFFRKKRKRIEQEVVQAKEEIFLEKETINLRKLRKTAKELRKQSQPDEKEKSSES